MTTQNKKLSAAFFVLIFVILNFTLGEVLETPKEDLIEKGKFDPKLRWEEFYNLPQGSIEVLFLGSSHAYRSFDPEIFDAVFKEGNSFNMGSSAQTPVTAYFVLKEVLKTQKPKAVVLEIFFSAFENDKQFVNATYNFEFIRSPDTRLDFFLNGYEPEDWIYFIAPSLRYRMNAADTLRLFLNRPIEYNEDIYAGSGYVENPETVTEDALRKSPMFEGYRFEPGKLNKKQLEYFDKIIDLCREQNIRLVFVTAPLPDISRSKIANYRDIHDYFLKIAKAERIPYLDYNLIDEEKDLFSTRDFKDADHLNHLGARKISADLARRLEPII